MDSDHVEGDGIQENVGGEAVGEQIPARVQALGVKRERVAPILGAKEPKVVIDPGHTRWAIVQPTQADQGKRSLCAIRRNVQEVATARW
jgi:hypothetical protein